MPFGRSVRGCASQPRAWLRAAGSTWRKFRVLFLQGAEGLFAILRRELVPEPIFILKDAHVAHAQKAVSEEGGLH